MGVVGWCTITVVFGDEEGVIPGRLKEEFYSATFQGGDPKFPGNY